VGFWEGLGFVRRDLFADVRHLLSS
jgi:hypothetical protein